ncbi:MAG: flavin reductase [Acholeplasmatales bacterium]|jgi:flavin reductase (DIM6/NTAB) family NADH-FMN oxidoreductase RutF/rubredoxin|nr:flavin reductase [Acholeplasmatales bacterium]
MDNTVLNKLTHGVYVVGVKKGGSFGGCVVDAVSQATMGDPSHLTLALSKVSCTNELIKKNKKLILSILPVDIDPFVIANFGFQSARDTSKWDNISYGVSNGMPYVSDSVGYIELKVAQTIEFESHTLFICAVVNTTMLNPSSESLVYAYYQRHLKESASNSFSNFKNGLPRSEKKVVWRCLICGHVYDGEIPFEELDDSWVCPICGVGKENFVKE